MADELMNYSYSKAITTAVNGLPKVWAARFTKKTV